MQTSAGEQAHNIAETRPPRLLPVVIPDADEGGVSDVSTPYPSEYEGHLGNVMISNKDILERTKTLAKLINEDYQGERPVFVCVLKGASMFFHHLTAELMKLKQGFTYEFIRASSYLGATTDTSGDVKLSKEFDFDTLVDRHVVLIEDIVDTGTTLARLIPVIQERGKTKSIEVCTLLEKRIDHERHRSEIILTKAKYSGFSIPNKFIIGFGLDYNELYRDLLDIWVISKAGVEFDGKL
eukprot:CAMPEP_0178517592 /NCGR_PEP_ID=MMETSP0696-20121128/25775_1 /TAXON_ID=265572 /ORGANISM="Extubocellulus spinifer, Strain CCMP396" /LENGTH=238 /DNA_ID=CAMNT_0020148037 /DNA_START=96 /DNA_END=812 /DNA_ORIENTATION=-